MCPDYTTVTHYLTGYNTLTFPPVVRYALPLFLRGCGCTLPPPHTWPYTFGLTFVIYFTVTCLTYAPPHIYRFRDSRAVTFTVIGPICCLYHCGYTRCCSRLFSCCYTHDIWTHLLLQRHCLHTLVEFYRLPSVLGSLRFTARLRLVCGLFTVYDPFTHTPTDVICCIVPHFAILTRVWNAAYPIYVVILVVIGRYVIAIPRVVFSDSCRCLVLLFAIVILPAGWV